MLKNTYKKGPHRDKSDCLEDLFPYILEMFIIKKGLHIAIKTTAWKIYSLCTLRVVHVHTEKQVFKKPNKLLQRPQARKNTQNL